MSWTTSWKRLLIGCSIVCFSLVCGAASADDETGASNGPGAMFRAGYINGQGVPQFRSLAPIEAFPFILEDNSLFFSDLRFFPSLNNLTNVADTTYGGNAGLGYRYYSDSYNRVFGGSLWYDADDTRNLYFQQIGISLESFGELIDYRTNVYLPVGAQNQQSSLVLLNGSQQFVGDNLTFNQLRTAFVAMKGFDMEAGLSVPWQFARDMALRVYGGGYYYVDNDHESITGASARMTANITSGLDAQVQVTYDNYYQTRAFVGLSWTFGPLHFSELRQNTAYGRIGDHVTRNYTVVAPQRLQVEQFTAINPATGKPYTFAHVNSGASGGGDGAVKTPFSKIGAAQSANRDVVFVQAGSVFNGSDASLVMHPGQSVIGDGNGIQSSLQVKGYGSLLLPHGPAGNLPILNAAPGDSVVLASNTLFTGFAINDAVGNGIYGNGVQNVTLSNFSIDHAGANGISLINSTGPVSIASPTITNSVGSGINIDGGSGPIAMTGTTTVQGAGGPAVAIANLASSGGVTFADLTINSRHNAGLTINNSAGMVTVTGTTSITNEIAATASALDIRNSAANFNFNTINVSAATGSPAVNLQNNTGTTTIQTANISTQNATALRAAFAGTLAINPAVNNSVNLNQGGTINAVGGTALDIQNTVLNVNLTSVSSSSAPVGISLISTSGLLAVFGNGTAGSGGTIQGAATGVFLQNTGLTGFQWMNIASNGVGIHAENVANLVVSNSTIANSTTFGIDALNTPALAIANSTFVGNGAANLRAQFNAVQSYAYSIAGTQFTSTNADNVDLIMLAGGTGSTMNFNVQNSLFNNAATSTAGINAGWNGVLTATINQSSFVETANSVTGVMINNASPASPSTISFTNNAYSTTGTFGTAFHLVSPGATVLTATNNLVQFGNTNGTGFQMSLVNPSVSISNNTFTDSTDGATGMLFDSVTGPGVIAINGNTITLTNSGALLDRGIIFSAVPTTFQLQGTTSNTISGADTSFLVPAGTTTGSIVVNGAAVP